MPGFKQSVWKEFSVNKSEPPIARTIGKPEVVISMSIQSLLQNPLKPVQDLMSEGVSTAQVASIIKMIGLPIVGLCVFLLLWQAASNSIVTSLGNFPSPAEVVKQFNNLIDEHKEERDKVAKKYERQEKRNQKFIDQGKPAKVKWREYKSRITFFDQIFTSLGTVMAGFIVASLIAIPIGIVIGLSASAYAAINPIIQTLKPVSPLAWLPLVTMVVSAL